MEEKKKNENGWKKRNKETKKDGTKEGSKNGRNERNNVFNAQGEEASQAYKTRLKAHLPSQATAP